MLVRWRTPGRWPARLAGPRTSEDAGKLATMGLTYSSEVARPPADVFAYVTDPSTFPQWQQGVVRGRLDTPTTQVGSKCTTVRKIGGREREVTTQITECDPPRRWADRGIDGPIRAIIKVAVEPLEDASHSRVTIDVEFAGRPPARCRGTCGGSRRGWSPGPRKGWASVSVGAEPKG